MNLAKKNYVLGLALLVFAVGLVGWFPGIKSQDSKTRWVYRDDYSIRVDLLDKEQLVDSRADQLRGMDLAPARTEAILNELSSDWRGSILFRVTFYSANEGKLTDDDLLYSDGDSKYGQGLNDFLFRLEEACKLRSSCGKSIRPELCNFERTHGLRPERSALVAFNADEFFENGRVRKCDASFIIDNVATVKHREHFDFSLHL